MKEREPMRSILNIGAIALCLFVAACSSNVRRADIADAGASVVASKYKNVSIKLTEDAKKKLADNLKFNADTLRGTVQRALEAHDLMRSAEDPVAANVEITITDMRVRSNVAAVLFGFFAGADSVTGDVHIKDASGKLLKNFEVSASYALGGLAGGQDEARMGWLYEKFAELTLKELAEKH